MDGIVSPHPYAEALMPSVMVSGGAAFGQLGWMRSGGRAPGRDQRQYRKRHLGARSDDGPAST